MDACATRKLATMIFAVKTSMATGRRLEVWVVCSRSVMVVVLSPFANLADTACPGLALDHCGFNEADGDRFRSLACKLCDLRKFVGNLLHLRIVLPAIPASETGDERPAAQRRLGAGKHRP